MIVRRLRPCLPAVLLAALAGGPAAAQEMRQPTPQFTEPQSRRASGDWLVECFAVKDSVPACQLYQRMLVNRGQAVALVAAIAFDAPSGKAKAQIALPLGIDLARGARFVVDQGDAYYFPITRCTFQGCLLESLLPDGLTEHMRKGTGASITVAVPNEDDFAIPLSLNGFATAYAGISAGPPAAGRGAGPTDRQITGSTPSPAPAP